MEEILASIRRIIADEPPRTPHPEAARGQSLRAEKTQTNDALPRDRAPYNVIFLYGATEVVPKSLLAQLKEEGRLIAIMGRGPAGRVILYRCVGGNVSGWPVFDAAAALLPGFAEPPTFVF